MLDIVSVGNQKLDYKDHKDIEFEPLSFYINLAQKTIAKFSKNFSTNIMREMLKSEDAIANVANAIMMADWRWDQDRKGLTGQQKTRYSYRNQCAIWAIKSYVSRKKNKKSKQGVNIHYTNDDNKESSLLDILCVDDQSPIDKIIYNEELSEIKNHISMLIDPKNKILSDRQSDYIRMYFFENKTFADIGKEFNITREAVRQGIKKSIEKIREIIN